VRTPTSDWPRIENDDRMDSAADRSSSVWKAGAMTFESANRLQINDVLIK
jgi:hypothetical protein